LGNQAVNDQTRAWVRSLPLLLMSSLLMLAAAWMFFQGKDNTASIAAFSAGLVLLGSWLATAVVDWHEGHPTPPRNSGVAAPIHEEDGDGSA
jgi:hypothetical protein